MTVTTKNNIIVDKIVKGITINKNNEINYTAQIVVELDKDIPLEYAVIDEENEDQIQYITAKKFIILKVSNVDGVFKKKLLMLKSSEKANAEITIDMDLIFNTPQFNDTLGPRGTILLNSTADGNNSSSSSNNSNNDPWYKNPWIIGGIILILILFFTLRKTTTRNQFLD